MALPVTIPNTFANATTSIPLSQLDTNFSTLANAVNGINSGSEILANLKSSNVTITGGVISNVTLDNVTVDVETLSNVTINGGNVTVTNMVATTANANTINVTTINARDGTASVSLANTTGIITLSNALVTTAGTSAAPSITFTGDTNTGIFSPAADTIAFTEGGAEAMRIDSSGNVGIGNTSPLARVDLGSTSGVKLLTYNGGAGSSQSGFGVDLSGSNFDLSLFSGSGTTGQGLITFGQRNSSTDVYTERMRIDSSGNVGIGVTSPTARLDVVGASGVGIYQRINNTTAGAEVGLQFADAGTLKWTMYKTSGNALGWFNHAGSATAMTLDSSGNLLVGITSARANAGDVQVSKGISFPATQSAQSDANTLDDYEEGTWTPTLPNGGTLTVSSARYVKIGQQVTVSFFVNAVAPTNNGSDFRIGGLPYANIGLSPALYYGGSFGYVGDSNLADWLPITGSYFTYIYFHIQGSKAP